MKIVAGSAGRASSDFIIKQGTLIGSFHLKYSPRFLTKYQKSRISYSPIAVQEKSFSIRVYLCRRRVTRSKSFVKNSAKGCTFTKDNNLKKIVSIQVQVHVKTDDFIFAHYYKISIVDSRWNTFDIYRISAF